jgi:hypothetical protein
MSEPCHRSFVTTVDDRGGIVLGWLTKLTVALALVGIVLFDGISVASTMATVSDQGATAASDASAVWKTTHNIQTTYDAAVKSALEDNPANEVSTKDFTVDPDGTVHLVISREAATLVLYRWSRTAKWAQVSAHAKGLDVS